MPDPKRLIYYQPCYGAPFYFGRTIDRHDHPPEPQANGVGNGRAFAIFILAVMAVAIGGLAANGFLDMTKKLSFATIVSGPITLGPGSNASYEFTVPSRAAGITMNGLLQCHWWKAR